MKFILFSIKNQKFLIIFVIYSHHGFSPLHRGGGCTMIWWHHDIYVRAPPHGAIQSVTLGGGGCEARCFQPPHDGGART